MTNTPQYGQQERPAAFTRAEKNTLRFRWHRPLVIASGLGTFLTALFLGVVIYLIIENGPGTFSLSEEDVDDIIWIFLLILFGPLVLMFVRLVAAAKARATGFAAPPDQFPEAWAYTQHYARLAGLESAPALIVVTGNNPMSTSNTLLAQHSIIVHNDLLEVSRPGGDCAAFRFAVAREIGHLIAGHRGFRYQFFTSLAKTVPYVKHALARAEEYTADRYATLLAPDAAPDYFGVLAVSKMLWLEANMREVAMRAGTGGKAEIVTAFALMEPPITWRVRALTDLGLFKAELPWNGLRVKDSDKGPRDPMISLERLPAATFPFRKVQGAFWVPPTPISGSQIAPLCENLTTRQRVESR